VTYMPSGISLMVSIFRSVGSRTRDDGSGDFIDGLVTPVETHDL
jgi:hypothetical protein